MAILMIRLSPVEITEDGVKILAKLTKELNKKKCRMVAMEPPSGYNLAWGDGSNEVVGREVPAEMHASQFECYQESKSHPNGWEDQEHNDNYDFFGRWKEIKL